MLVKNLVSWAGHGHSYAPGQHVDLAEDVAKSRIAAGLATKADKGAVEGDSVLSLKKLNAELEDKFEAAHKRMADAEKTVATLTAELEAATTPGNKTGMGDKLV